MKMMPKHLHARYVVLTHLAANAGLYAGKQGQDSEQQEQALWEWAARILGYALDAAEPRQFWQDAFMDSYLLGRQSIDERALHYQSADS